MPEQVRGYHRNRGQLSLMSYVALVRGLLFFFFFSPDWQRLFGYYQWMATVGDPGFVRVSASGITLLSQNASIVTSVRAEVT